MAYGVLIKNRTASMNVDTLNRSVVASADINNGKVFNLNYQGSATGSAAEVWSVVSGSALYYDDMWMAASPEIVLTASKYKGIDPDPRNFTNVSGLVFDAFKPQEGDIITLTAVAIAGSPSTGAYVTSGSEAYSLVWVASGSQTGIFQMKLIAETYISIGTGAIDTQRVLAYKLEVEQN